MSLEGYYNVVELEYFGGRIKLKEKSLRNLANNELLVKIKYATINSADLLFLKGEMANLSQTTFPIVPGFEACGEIVKVGSDIDRSYVGKKVAILTDLSQPGSIDGVWADYYYANLSNLMVFDSGIEYRKILFILNPLISIGIFDTIRKLQVESVVQTYSPCSSMIYNLCSRDGIKVVNLVKDENNYKSLKSVNVCNVVKMSDTEWPKELQKLCLHFNVQTTFSYLSGKSVGSFINALPMDSTVYQFGLPGDSSVEDLQSSELIFNDKKLKGWWVVNWMKSLTTEENLYWMNYLQSELKSNSGVFDVTEVKTFKLNQISQALQFFQDNESWCNVILEIN
jgi:NADPH:quinone reductase-like Zn-dependent oxidoreductase